MRVESEGCSRYLGLAIDGVQNGCSPDWMRFLLLAVGQRPLDLFVDISNFVMLDLGQPNHLFDRERLSADGIVVRDARPGETMTTLDGIERSLGPEDMLISSGDEAVALAGVMGGERSKVGPETSSLLLEVAAFQPTLVRRSAARLGLRTDASARFEKHLDPTLPAKAAGHMLNLLRELQPGLRLPQPLGDAGTWSDPACTVELRPERVRAVLGSDVDDDAIANTLTALGFGVERGATWTVAVPSQRASKDVGIEEDLIEEVGRMVGYGTIAERTLTAEIVPAARDERRLLVRRLQDRLSGAARFHEAMLHTFQADQLLETLRLGDKRHVQVINPQVEGASRVRRSILPGLIGILVSNRRRHGEVRLFEVGKGYRPEESNKRGEPRELHELALLWCADAPAKGARFDSGTFARMQGVLEDLLRHAGVGTPEWRRGDADSAPSWAHPGKWMTAHAADGSEVGRLAELEPGLVRELGLVGELAGDTAVAELSIDQMLAAPPAVRTYQPLPRFPGIKVDVALAVPEELAAGDLVAAISKASKGLAISIELFDLYRGESVGDGKKSLAYHVLLQSPGRTLTDKEEAKFLDRVERGVHDLGGELRRE